MTQYIANHKRKIAHIVTTTEPLSVLCGAPVVMRNFYYVDKSDIRDFMDREEYRRLWLRGRSPQFRLCYYCRRKMPDG